jgi:intracellular sulfur oxidation DsrE/DsrF family protein
MKRQAIFHRLSALLAALVVMLAATRAGIAAAADAAAARHPSQDEVIKVVYHADFGDPRRFSAMLTNIYNMASTYQSQLADYDIRIVFVSYGIRFVTRDPLRGTPFAEDAELAQRRENLLGRLQTLHDTYGVKLELCNITREQVGLEEKKLIPGITLVPSGVVRIAELEHKGYAYLKVE